MSDVEEAAAEALTTAVERWPADGVPPNPGACPTTTATRKAIDRIPVETPRSGGRPGRNQIDRAVN
jgi:RNA polymerase sigma-70 factor, ECF subfamily